MGRWGNHTYAGKVCWYSVHSKVHSLVHLFSCVVTFMQLYSRKFALQHTASSISKFAHKQLKNNQVLQNDIAHTLNTGLHILTHMLNTPKLTPIPPPSFTPSTPTPSPTIHPRPTYFNPTYLNPTYRTPPTLTCPTLTATPHT